MKEWQRAKAPKGRTGSRRDKIDLKGREEKGSNAGDL